MAGAVDGRVVMAVVQKAWKVFGPWTNSSHADKHAIARWVKEQCGFLEAHPEEWPEFKRTAESERGFVRLLGERSEGSEA